HRQVRMGLLGDVEHLEAVEPASLQPDVEDDELRPALLDGAQRLVGIARRARAMAVILKEARHHLAYVRLVVDDQDVRGHLLLLGTVNWDSLGTRDFGNSGERRDLSASADGGGRL